MSEHKDDSVKAMMYHHATDQHDHKEILKSINAMMLNMNQLTESVKEVMKSIQVQNAKLDNFMDFKAKVNKLEEAITESNLKTVEFRTKVETQSRILWVCGSAAAFSIAAHIVSAVL